MQIITLKSDCFPQFPMTTGDVGFPLAGTPYSKLVRGSEVLITEVNARDPKTMFGGTDFEARSANGDLRPWRWPTDLSGKKLLLIRPGGVGDLLFLTPLCRKLKQAWPDCQITVAAFSHFLPILQGNPDVDRLIYYPFLRYWLDDYDYHVDFEGVIEENPEAEQTPAVDMVGRWVGVEFADEQEKRLRLEITDEERWQDRYRWPREGNAPRIGLQLSASSIIRCYPHPLWKTVILGLLQKGTQVFVLGDAQQQMAWGRTVYDKQGKALRERMPDPPGCHNLLGQFKDIKRAAVFASTLDLLICPDSAFVHIAGALEKPCVAIYGPFPRGVRTTYYPMCLSVEPESGSCKRMPCYLHGGDPCPEAGLDPWSPCLKQIPPQCIVDMTWEIVESIRRDTVAA